MSLLENQNISQLSWIKIGGKAKYLYTIYKFSELKNILEFIKEKKINFKIIGSGSNIFFNDYFDGIIIINKYVTYKEFNCYPIDYLSNNSNIFCFGSGTLLNDVIDSLAKKKYDMSSLAGIPGTLGGAVFNNAGAYGKDISYFFEACSVLDKYNQLKIYKRSDMEFSYRSSVFKNKCLNSIIVDVYLKVPLTNDNLTEKITKILDKRRSKLPLSNNIGCIFKNINLTNYKLIVGQLIEKLDFDKKYKNLSLFEKHHNIIVNNSKCSPHDMIKFINIIKRKFSEVYNLNLELEIQII